MTLARAIRKWRRKSKRAESMMNLAAMLTNRAGDVAYSQTMLIEMSRKLASCDPATVDRLHGFIENLGSRTTSGARAVVRLMERENYSGSLRLLVNHFEHLLYESAGMINPANFISETLVSRYRLHEWHLPVEREQAIIDLILKLKTENRHTGDWLVPYLLVNPDKHERVMEMLLQREVTSAEAMEVLLDDDVPMVMQEGAL